MDQLDPESSPSRPAGDAVEASPAVLRAEGLTKSFAGVTVVDAATVVFRAGEVHGLIGQNGAGKSTLMKMVSGVYRADAGCVRIGDETMVFSSPRQARDRGVSVVAQELSLVPGLSVAENILLGQQPNRVGIVDRRQLVSKAQRLIDDFDFGLDASVIVSTLPPSAQQKVEILRALASEAKLIVLDEPTSSMSIDDSRKLYDIIELLAARGAAVVLVSHFLEEIIEVCDVVTVMRDGHVVRASEPTDELTPKDLVQHMVGDVAAVDGPTRDAVDRTGTPRLAVDALGGRGFHDVSLDVHPGEIVALVGLVGAGRSEILRSIFGVDRPTSGAIELDGEQVQFRRPADAVRAGLGMVTESRKDDGIFPVLSTTTNIAVGQPRATSRWGFIRRGLEQRTSRTIAEAVDVRGPIDGPITSLSGGNQQKALLGRWLVQRPRLYLIDEPTRGVDVVSIKEIQALLRTLAAEGMSVLMVTSEFDEALDVADRIYVVRNGTIVHETESGNTNKPALLAHAFGAEKEAVTS